MKVLYNFIEGNDKLSCSIFFLEEINAPLEDVLEELENINSKDGPSFWKHITFFAEGSNGVFYPEGYDVDSFNYDYLIDVIYSDIKHITCRVFDKKGRSVNLEENSLSPKYSLLYYKDSERRECDYIVTEILEQDKNHLKCICAGKGYRNFKVKNIVSLKKI